VQVLGLLAGRKGRNGAQPSLVVAPKSLVFNWEREAQRFAPGLRVVAYAGVGPVRKQLREQIPQTDLVITTYDLMRQEIDYFSAQAFDYVFLDEAQAIKNAQSQRAKAARCLQARRRLALSGTPIENRLSDLWSILDFLNPGMLGSGTAFGRFTGKSVDDGGGPGHLDVLQRVVRPFVLRRTKAHVAPELPQRVEQTISCNLGPQQEKYYNELRDAFRLSLLKRVDSQGLAKSKIHVLEALLRLRQAACHPGLIDSDRAELGSAKLETAMEMLESIVEEGHKALVYSQFTSMLAFVRAALDQRGVTYEYLDGQTQDRSRRVDRFQNDEKCPLFLLSLKAGGVGLNLTAAEYVFLLDPWWNPATEAQAIDRTHRIGQNKNVIAYRLIAHGTVEEKIVELQQSKRRLAESVITDENSFVAGLTRDDLAMLLS
jgi:SNF2 family DNA or RNA helicase